MRRRHFLAALMALPAAVAGALAVKAAPVKASPVWTGKSIDDTLIGQFTSLRTSGSVALNAGDELWAETLVAQDTHCISGGRSLIAPTTKLLADVTVEQQWIDVRHNDLLPGDIVRLEATYPSLEYMRIRHCVGPIESGHRYAVTRNIDGFGASAWTTGQFVVSMGPLSNADSKPHWSPPPLTTEQRAALADYYGEQSQPVGVLVSTERSVMWVPRADGGWDSVWYDRPVAINLELDGRRITELVTEHQTRDARLYF